MSSCKVHDVRFYNLEPRAVHCMAYEPQHRKIALSRSDHSIEVWDVNSAPHVEHCLSNLRDNSVESLAWCGTRLFSTGLQGLVVEYDLFTLSRKYSEPVNCGPAWCLDISKDKSHLAIGTEDGYISLFEIFDESIQYVKWFDKQEGRILCLSWDTGGNRIVTGSADTVRIWNVHTGHVIHRMTTGRTAQNKETIVWCVAVTSDFTIITGDSRGRLSFWNGHQGILIDSFPTLTADVLCLCLSEDENSVYCSGVDSLITSFSRIHMHKYNDESHHWVKSAHRRIHEHDVRALVISGSRLFSSGFDGYLALSCYPSKLLIKYPPVLQGPCAVVCSQARCLLLRFPAHIEVWLLAEKLHIPRPLKLLTLQSQGGEPIVCASISSDAQWLAYSTPTALRFFSFRFDSDEPKLLKLRNVPQECGPSQWILFAPNDNKVVVATSDGQIMVLQMGLDDISIVYILHPFRDKLLKDRVYLLEISPDRQFLVAADHKSNFVVWKFSNGQLHGKLPQYSWPPTAMGIQQQNNVVITYADHKILEYSIPQHKYTRFSRDLGSRHPKQWLSKGYSINSITFDPRNSDIIILHDDNAIYVINKNKSLPYVNEKIPRLDVSLSDSNDSFQSHPRTADPPHAFHVIKKYKHLVHLDWLSDDELVAVEVTPSSILEKLPPILKRKRFGLK